MGEGVTIAGRLSENHSGSGRKTSRTQLSPRRSEGKRKNQIKRGAGIQGEGIRQKVTLEESYSSSKKWNGAGSRSGVKGGLEEV